MPLMGKSKERKQKQMTTGRVNVIDQCFSVIEA